MKDAHSVEILAQARRGDSSAIGQFYELYRVRIFRYLYYRLGDRQSAEDLTSEVFIRVMRALPEYRSQDGNVQAWLFQIARNLTIDYYRKQGRRPVEALHENIPSSSEDPDSAAERALNSEWLKKALAQLTNEQREAVILRIVVGMPVAEVAALMGKSEDAIKGLQRRGLVALRAVLTEWKVTYG
ncbi:MAG: sigma-70 family RNA polymerase sigma factor [Chloroflexi bacterium]|nr:sigma-70 family RNA polymerase sigma factor [Anaerolineaceae bacterium]NMB89065.1 sigma-70 family RNA polymerase sigma factor [Chloroflexota bacterium]